MFKKLTYMNAFCQYLMLILLQASIINGKAIGQDLNVAISDSNKVGVVTGIKKLIEQYNEQYRTEASAANQLLLLESNKPLSCFIVPVTIQTSIESKLGYGIGLGGMIYLPISPDCCENTPFPFLCFLAGPSLGINVSYLPEDKYFDFSASIRYRVLYLFAGLDVGYASNSLEDNTEKTDFMHFDPTIGLDVIQYRIMLSMIVRTEKLDGSIFGGRLAISYSPFAFSKTSSGYGRRSIKTATQILNSIAFK